VPNDSEMQSDEEISMKAEGTGSDIDTVMSNDVDDELGDNEDDEGVTSS